ncbi:MAG: hypothetical protein KKD18_01145 [Nanoarchaeota archaeon]|nr:hypothetical protein [Nanoarchaeota archaeon]
MTNSTGLERITQWENTWKQPVPINPPLEGYAVVRVLSKDVSLPRDTWAFIHGHGNQDGSWISPEKAREMELGGYHQDGVYNTPEGFNFVTNGSIYAVREDWLNQQETSVARS